jgi:hypothetical protein
VTPAAARVIPFATYIAFLILETMLAGDAYGFDSRWLYAVKIACVAVALGILWNRYSELRADPPGAAQLLASVAIGVVRVCRPGLHSINRGP